MKELENTATKMTEAQDKIHGAPLLTEPVQKRLNQRQQLDYAEERRDLIEWLVKIGKDPERGEGYSPNTVKTRSYRMDQFYRWVWTEEDGYTTNITTEHADKYTEELKLSDKSNIHKNNCLKSLKMLYKWRKHRRDGKEWKPDMTFKTERSSPRDFLRMDEREKIRKASLEYGSIPGYNDLSPEQRDRWKTHLAQRFSKPKEEVVPEDWDRANGWKIPSLVYASLDAGLRPVEVENAKVSWIDLDNGELRIDKDEAAKERDNYSSVLTQKTQKILKRWLKERKTYEKYDDSDHIWLTREGNPYQSHSLKYLITRLAEEAGLDTDNRNFHWYMIRHSTGTYLRHSKGKKSASTQLRHTSTETVEIYDQAPPEMRREGLEEI